MDPEDVTALRAMTLEQQLKRGLDFMEQPGNSRSHQFAFIIRDGVKRK